MFDKKIIEALYPLTDLEQIGPNGEEPSWRKTFPNNGIISIERKAMLESGFLFGLRKHPRLLPFPPHMHDHVELTIMVKGKSVHHVNGKTIILNEGEILLLSQQTLHEVETTSQEDIAVYVNILPEYLGNIFGIFENTDSVIRFFCLDALAGGKSGIHLHYLVSENTRVQYILNFIIFSLLFKPKMYKSLVKDAFELLFKLLQTCNDDLEVYSLDHSAIIPAVRRYVEEQYYSGSLEELARQLHYNKSSLSRFIKSKTGENFISLIQNKRLDVAAELLASTRKTVAEISSEVGYDNVSYFHKVFRKHFGISPSEYRKGDLVNQ